MVSDLGREQRGSRQGTRLAAPATLPPVLPGGLAIVADLGHGDFADVYEVLRDGVGYAVKVLRAAGDNEQLRAARREAALLTCVNHPGLNRIHDVGLVEGRPYLAMDLVEGRPLTELLQQGPLAADRVTALGCDVAGALAAAHRAGVVHRDVKPDNILITDDSRAVLIDFGLATRRGEQSEGSLAVVGTLTYSAPEQTGMLNRPVDGRSDLYALGAVLFEAATGRPPFVAEDPAELMRQHLVAEPPELAAIRPELPPALTSIIHRLLAKDPDNRYPSAEGLATDLEQVRTPSLRPPSVDDEGARGAHPPGDTRITGPLVNRSEEKEALAAAWRAAAAAPGGFVLVGGAPGCGKTRLVQEFVDELRSAGRPVLSARCGTDEPPLGSVRRAVETYVASLDTLSKRDREIATDRLVSACAAAMPRIAGLSVQLGELLQVEPPAGPPGAVLAKDVATVLSELARVAGGAVLHLDDAHRLDSAGAEVLRLLADAMPETPLLVVLTGSDEPADGPFASLVGGLVEPSRIVLGPLTEAEATALVVTQLGGATADPRLASRLASPGAGNPAAVLAYVDAVIDAGLLHPSWGRWVLDEPGLEALSLPSSLRALTARRLAALAPTTRRVIRAAAVIGLRFEPDLVRRVSSTAGQEVADALAETAQLRLTAEAGGGRYTFAYNDVREAVLTSTPQEELRRLHQQAAEARAAGLDLAAVYEAAARHVMSRSGPAAVTCEGRLVPSEEVYAVAHHSIQGDPARHGHQAFQAVRAAGVLALAEHAPYESVIFLDRMHEYAAATDEPVESTLSELTAIAYLRHGRLAEARGHFRTAIGREPERWARIRLHLRLSQVALALFDTEGCLAAVHEGIRESGRPLPADGWRLSLATGWAVLVGTLRSALGPWGRARGDERARYRYLAMLYCVGMAVSQASPRRATQLHRHARPLRARLRGSAEDLVLDASREIVEAGLGHRRKVRRLEARLDRVRLDSYGTATVAVRRALAGVLDERDGRADRLAAALAQHGRVIHIGDLLLTTSALLGELALRGRSQELIHSHERACRNAYLGTADRTDHPFRHLAAAAHAAVGNRTSAGEQLERLREACATEPAGSLLHLRMLAVRLHAAGEFADFGEEFERAAAELTALYPRPDLLPPGHRDCWVWLTAGRVAQCAQATGQRRQALLLELEQAAVVLGRLAGTPLLRAHLLLVTGWTAQLHGDAVAALGYAGRADALGQLLDAPLVEFEAARLRARAMQRLEDPAGAERAAGMAVVIAEQQGWGFRVKILQQMFRVETTRWVGQAIRVSRERAEVTLHGRRLQALQQVSLAAAAVLDPRRLARVALDETLRILAAERAMLFLVHEADHGLGRTTDRQPGTAPRGVASNGAESPDELVPYLGRCDGEDIDVLSDYSSTLVARVAETGTPLVVTGSAEGAALGSRSAVVHDLRSILVAPLHLADRLVGVVYLDSRIASGIFTDEDVDILLAITHHIAVSFETARAAELAADIKVAHRQRDLAELLRSSLVRVSGMHDPKEILQDTLSTVSSMLDAPAYLLLNGPDRITVAAATGGGSSPGPECDVLAERFGWLRHLGEARGVVTGQGSPLPGLAECDWIALPLTVQGVRLGSILALTRNQAEAQVELAGALIEQSLVAYRNAQLMTRLQRIAAVDELTGVASRRHFFELAGTAFSAARRRGDQLAAIMLDVDHFKQVNDRYGHAVGDEVLVEVARRLTGISRQEDVLGRYGGEEFALILPMVPIQAAELAGRLRTAIAGSPIGTTAGPITVTISLGVAVADSRDSTVEALLSRADAALYQAKAAGRDRVAVAEIAS